MAYKLFPVSVVLNEQFEVVGHQSCSVEDADLFTLNFEDTDGYCMWVADFISYDDALMFIALKES